MVETVEYHNRTFYIYFHRGINDIYVSSNYHQEDSDFLSPTRKQILTTMEREPKRSLTNQILTEYIQGEKW